MVSNSRIHPGRPMAVANSQSFPLVRQLELLFRGATPHASSSGASRATPDPPKVEDGESKMQEHGAKKCLVHLGHREGDWMGRARAGRDEQRATYTCTLPMALCAHTNHVLQVPVDAIAMRQGELSWDNTSPR